MTRDMTEGSPLRLILQFSLPLLAGNLFQQTYNMVDAIIVGRVLGANALAAVGASSSVQFLVLGFCIGICGGFSIPVAQRFGAKNYSAMRQCIFLGGILTIFFALLLTIPCALFCDTILRALSTPHDIFADAYTYLLIIFLGIPSALLYNLLAGILRAVGDSRTPFIFLVISAILNSILDVVFIVLFKCGVEGAAFATVISQTVSAILCILVIVIKFSILHPKKNDMRWDFRKVGELFAVGLPMGLQYSITAIGSMVMQAANNALGSIYVSAFTAGSKIKQFTMCPFDALATAVSTFASQNYGAAKISRIKKGIKEGVFIGVLYGLCIGLLLVLFGRPIAMIFIEKSDTAIIDAASSYARAIGCFMWLIGILNVMRMTTQGLGFSSRAIFSGVMEMLARCVVSFALVPIFGFTAICFCDQSAWLCAVLYITPTCLHCVHKIEKLYARPQ